MTAPAFEAPVDDVVQLARRCGWEPPTAEQRAVIEAPLEPLVVVAGAGSGKTATMAMRVVWLIATGQIRADAVLGLTFTRKAAGELATRIRRRLSDVRALSPQAAIEEEPTISTYHSYAARLLADHALRAALEPGARLASPAIGWQIASQVVDDYDGPMDAIGWRPDGVTAAVVALAAELSEHLQDSDAVRTHTAWLREQAGPGPHRGVVKEMLDHQAAREQLLPLVEAYTQRKRDRGLIDHGDQVALIARIARDHPDVGAAERARFGLVLLDEYQDTGHAQRELLRAVFGGGHPVTAVGDPCQSIYGWRGASAGGLHRFPTDFPGSRRPATVLHLATSFRNADTILRTANRLAGPLRTSGVDLPDLRAAPDRLDPGLVQCALLDTADDEAAWVAEQIATMLATGPLRPADVAVLVRKRAQLPRLRAALADRDLPVEVVGLGGLLTVPEVADIVATLSVLVDPGAGPAALRLLTGPRWRLGPRDLAALGRRARELHRASADPTTFSDPLLAAVHGADEDGAGSLVDAVDDPGPPDAYSPAGHQRLLALGAELRRLRKRLQLPLPDLVTEIEQTLLLDVELAARPGVDPAAARADLDAFLDAAAAFAGEGEAPTVRAFLGYLAAAEEHEFGLEPGRVGSSDSVKLLTVHAAKGLEWPVVVVPGLVEGTFPAKSRVTSAWTRNARVLPFSLRGDSADLPTLASVDSASLTAFAAAVTDRELLEERRLAYVAATRAEQRLICTGAYWGEGVRWREPSVVLQDVVDSGAQVSVWAEPPASDAVNPLRSSGQPVPWPVPTTPDPAVQAAAGLVRTADVAARPESAVALEWRARAELLLAERAAAGVLAEVEVSLPAQLSVSTVVQLRRDPLALARALRRPMPQRPSPAARRGTDFHAWLEHRFGQGELLDVEDLPGSADDSAPSATLTELQAAFQRSPWWARRPHAVEVPFELRLAGVTMRGRVDAVFADDDGGWTIVDWKTGDRPEGAELAVVATQLGVYRIAWARLADCGVDRVRAAFHYVAFEQTVWLHDLVDEAELARLVESVPVG